MTMIKHNWAEMPSTMGMGPMQMHCTRCRKKVPKPRDSNMLEGLKTERCERVPIMLGPNGDYPILERMRIGSRYFEAELEDLADPEITPYGEKVRRYCERIRKFKTKGVGLFLWGDNSRGKSHVAAVVLKEARRVGFSGLLISPRHYIDGQITKEWFDEETTLAQRAEEVDFLVLDDMGKEYVKKSGSSGWSESNLEYLWRERSKHNRVTLVTTNLTDKLMKERYGKSIFQLVLETLVPLNVKGKNFRVAEHKRLRNMLES